MRIIIDIEANRLENPDKIWVIQCYDIDKDEWHVFRPETTVGDRQRFLEFSNQDIHWIGHHLLGYDLPVLLNLGYLDDIQVSSVTDTLVVSRLVDYPRTGHSLEDYGEEFGLPKGSMSSFSEYSEEMVSYCKRDVEITYRIYKKYLKYISKPEHQSSIRLEHEFQYYVVNQLENNGFAFNVEKASKLLTKVTSELAALDKDILSAFKPRLKLIREITPKATKHGTISLSSIPKILRGNIHDYNIDAPFSYCKWVVFNPSSTPQLISVLNEAGWKPVNKTKTHVNTEREYNILKRKRLTGVDTRLKELYDKLNKLKITGWKVDETNLETLPRSAPEPARLLAKRILLEARRRTLTEWLELVRDDGRIHGRFFGIGAWTHRMAHQNPNTANIPNEFDTAGKKKLYGKELRSFWQAPKGRLLVGVDAEGIQLRIFAHYIDDPEFTKSLVEGKKEDKSDPHSLNQQIIGSTCKSRAAAKRFIYAMLLGAGIDKLAEILQCSREEAAAALERIMDRYEGFRTLKETRLPADGKRGYFIGLDGRLVRIPGDTAGGRTHLSLSGYLQNGEAVVMKRATLKWINKLKEYDAKLVNFVHDEWQTECPNDMARALDIARMQARSLEEVGRELNLKCPLAGSFFNDDIKDYTIDMDWSKTH